MAAPTFKLKGETYVILSREEYERLSTLAKAAELPSTLPADAKGNYPAVEHLRASIARDIVRERAELGLSQRDLAELAGVRVETLCRIETGKHTPSVRTIDRIDHALRSAQAQRAKISLMKKRGR